MNINKKVIDDLKKNNEKISKMLSSISDLKENELESVLKEIQKLRVERTKPKEKKKESSVNVDKKINSSILSLFKLIPNSKDTKKEQVIDFKKLIPKPIVQKPKKQNANLIKQDFLRHENNNDVQEEKLKTLKSISSRLDSFKKLKISGKGEDDTKPNDKDSTFDKIKNSLLGSAIGAGVLKGLGKLKKVGFKKTFGGAGKLLGHALTIKMVFDLIGDIKTGYSDYKKYKALGDNVKANQAMFKSFIGASGSLVNILANFAPLPLKLLLYPLGTFLDSTASEFDNVISDKSNVMMQAQISADYAKDRLGQGQKFNILQLRPNIKDLTYEYKNYETDSWEPLLDSSGTPLSLASGKKRVEENGSEKGINKYKLKTGGTYADLVLVDGKPKMKVGDNISEISPRQKGGEVKKNNQYLVGEKGPELYQTNELKSRSELSIFRNTFFELNNSFKKLVKNLSISNIKDFFTAETISYNLRNKPLSLSGKEVLDFSKMPTDDTERFNTFLKQVYSFEGGFSDVAGDIRTNLGITQPIYNTYRKDKGFPVQDVLNITKDEADEAYYKYFYKPSKTGDIQDPKLAYAYFDMYLNGSPQDAKTALRNSGGDVNKFLDLRDSNYKKITKLNKKNEKFLEGWLARNQSIRNMIKNPIQTVEISSSKDIKTTPIIQKDVVDANFIMKNILPKMAEAVRNNAQ